MLWTPTLRVARVTDLTPDRLASLGVKGLLLDLDNTLAAWNDPRCPDDVQAWLKAVGSRGVQSVIVSNNAGARVLEFAARVGLPAVAHAAKPSRDGFRRGLARIGTDPRDTLAVGDRLFMDIIGGNRTGVRTVLVTPISRREFWGTRMVRFAEERFVPALPSVGVPFEEPSGPVGPSSNGFGDAGSFSA